MSIEDMAEMAMRRKGLRAPASEPVRPADPVEAMGWDVDGIRLTLLESSDATFDIDGPNWNYMAQKVYGEHIAPLQRGYDRLLASNGLKDDQIRELQGQIRHLLAVRREPQMTEPVRTGPNRVYWHGVFPKIDRQGTLHRRGTIRHEVEWDDQPGVIHLLSVNFLKPVGQWKKCDCGRCGKEPT